MKFVGVDTARATIYRVMLNVNVRSERSRQNKKGKTVDDDDDDDDDVVVTCARRCSHTSNDHFFFFDLPYSLDIRDITPVIVALSYACK